MQVDKAVFWQKIGVDVINPTSKQLEFGTTVVLVQLQWMAKEYSFLKQFPA